MLSVFFSDSLDCMSMVSHLRALAPDKRENIILIQPLAKFKYQKSGISCRVWLKFDDFLQLRNALAFIRVYFFLQTGGCVMAPRLFIECTFFPNFA